MVILGALTEYTKLLPIENIKEIIPHGLKRKQLIEANLRVIDAGVQWVRDNVKPKPRAERLAMAEK